MEKKTKKCNENYGENYDEHGDDDLGLSAQPAAKVAFLLSWSACHSSKPLINIIIWLNCNDEKACDEILLVCLPLFQTSDQHNHHHNCQVNLILESNLIGEWIGESNQNQMRPGSLVRLDRRPNQCTLVRQELLQVAKDDYPEDGNR